MLAIWAFTSACKDSASGISDLICVIGLMKSVPAGGGGTSVIMGLGGFMPASRLPDVADSTGWCHEL